MKNKVIGLLTSSFLVVSAFAISGPKIEAQAVTKKITQTFANTLENGTLPSANGSIYTSYGSLKSTAPASNFNTVSGTYIDSCLLQNKSADLCKEFVQSPALFLCIKKDLPATPSPSTV